MILYKEGKVAEAREKFKKATAAKENFYGKEEAGRLAKGI